MNVSKSPSLWPGLHQLAGATPAINSPVCAGLQHRCRFSPSAMVYNARPTHLSEPLLMLRSSLPSVSRGLVYINTLGRTCMHELFIEYERVTAWEARFSSKIGGELSCIISRCLHWMVQWAGAQVDATTVWLTSKHPVGRNHWPSC